MSEASKVFKNRNQARKYLTDLGYKISNGNFYKHTDAPPKGDGLLRMNDDGSISESDLISYAQTHLKLNPAQSKAANKSAGASSELVDAKLDGQRLQNKAREVRLLKETGQLISMDEHKQELVRTVVLIKNSLFELCSKVAPSLLALAEQPNAASLMDEALRHHMAKVFNDLAKPSTFYEILDSDVQEMLAQLEGADNG